MLIAQEDIRKAIRGPKRGKIFNQMKSLNCFSYNLSLLLLVLILCPRLSKRLRILKHEGTVSVCGNLNP